MQRGCVTQVTSMPPCFTLAVAVVGMYVAVAATAGSDMQAKSENAPWCTFWAKHAQADHHHRRAHARQQIRISRTNHAALRRGPFESYRLNSRASTQCRNATPELRPGAFQKYLVSSRPPCTCNGAFCFCRTLQSEVIPTWRLSQGVPATL